jgi:hypothetical protein
VPPNVNQSTTNSDPGVIITPSSTPKQNESPLLDGKLPAEELIPPVVSEGTCDESGDGGARRSVQPYGGGHPTDWPWGCGGNPYRTGPGLCDNYRIGPRWHVTIDGMVMHREGTDPLALATQMAVNDVTGTVDGAVPPLAMEPALTNFSYAPGGRIAFMSQVGPCSGYDIQAVYEGINDWNASVVFPKIPFTAVPNGFLNVPPTQFVIQPSPNTEPPGPFPETFQQRSLHYRSNLNSVELNWLPYHDAEWRPIFGARVIRFDDEIADSLNQEVQAPLPGPRTDGAGNTDPLGPTSETDRLNLFHLDNTLMGFQVGLLHDTIQLTNRLALEGFINGGVYYNQVKYSNVMVVSTTQTFADNTRFNDATGINNGRVDNSSIVNNDNRDFAEISYEAEASLTGVCRLNKCWALRAGYQVMWLNHIHTADAAYLGTGDFSRDLLFHGWHAGVECRR